MISNIDDFSVRVAIKKRARAEINAPMVESIWDPYMSARIPLKGAMTNIIAGKEVIIIPAFSVE